MSLKIDMKRHVVHSLVMVILLCGGAGVNNIHANPLLLPQTRNAGDFIGLTQSVSLIDHSGAAFNFKHLDNSITLVNFIFTGCSSACPLQTIQLKKLRKSLLEKHPKLRIKFVSISLTPQADTPVVLSKYADQFEIPLDDNWTFLTGDNDAVELIASTFGMKTTLSADNTLDHLTNLYLLGKNGMLMKTYDGNKFDEVRMLAELVSLHRVSFSQSNE